MMKSGAGSKSAFPLHFHVFPNKVTDEERLFTLRVIAALSALCGKGLPVITAMLVSVSAPLVVQWSLSTIASLSTDVDCIRKRGYMPSTVAHYNLLVCLTTP